MLCQDINRRNNSMYYKYKKSGFQIEIFSDCVMLKFTVVCDSDKVTVNYVNNGNMEFDIKVRLCANDK